MRHSFIPLLAMLLSVVVSGSPAEDRLAECRSQRRAMLDRPRAVIFNNDGGDAYLYPRKDLPFSLERFLARRTAPLVGTAVTTLSYCTISSSFGQFTHATVKGEQLLNRHQRPGYVNATPEFAALGTDPLREIIRFARAHRLEVFWSNRINDTHDVIHRPDKPYERWSKLKQAHPEYLIGRCGERLPSGRWSAMDFSRPEVRALAVAYITEVCENYDVDGIELDFFRHLYLFGSVARGGTASPAELAELTAMIAAVRHMTETVAMRRGRPLLVAVRVPDSAAYCRGVGIDLERWLRDGLVDIVIGSDYFRLNPWSYLAELGHRYKVKVYAGLSEPRVKNEHPLLQRNSRAAYRARAAAAWQAGVDGIYIFNNFDVAGERMGYLREIGSAAALTRCNKVYFVTCRNGNPAACLRDGRKFRHLPLLTPANPAELTAAPRSYDLYLGREAPGAGYRLALYALPQGIELPEVTFNGRKLARPTPADGLLLYPVPESLPRPGINRLTVKKAAATPSGTKARLLDAALVCVHDPTEKDPLQPVKAPSGTASR